MVAVMVTALGLSVAVTGPADAAARHHGHHAKKHHAKKHHAKKHHAKKHHAGGCDSNYSGACVPIASDVDCAGGSGNGPAYVSGPVYIVGSDIYDLDRDGDGVGCD